MTHNLPVIVQFIGSVAGGVGVCIAVYLRLVYTNHVPKPVVAGFFLYGASLVIATLPAYQIGPLPSAIASIVSVLAFSALEILSAYVVFRRYNVRLPTKSFQRLLDGGAK